VALNALSFTVTAQPSPVTAGVATASNAVIITAVKNGQTDTAYTGTLAWSGANASPSGATATLGTGVTPAAQPPSLRDSARAAAYHPKPRSVVHFSAPESGALFDAG
jgi:hypothetical protein